MTNADLHAHQKLFGRDPDSADHIPDMELSQGILWCEIITIKLQIGDLQEKLAHMERRIAEHGNRG